MKTDQKAGAAVSQKPKTSVSSSVSKRVLVTALFGTGGILVLLLSHGRHAQEPVFRPTTLAAPKCTCCAIENFSCEKNSPARTPSVHICLIAADGYSSLQDDGHC